MSYILENEAEADRLELQKEIKAYSIADELIGLSLNNKVILDAGCGGGDVSQYLIENSVGSKIVGCDQSDIRVAHAKKKNPTGEFFSSPLEKIEAMDNSFDLVVCRYVFEYLKNPIQVLKEFQRVTIEGGEIIVIDIDGVFKNLFTANPIFNQQLEKVVSEVDVDLNAGRKIASFFHQAELTVNKVEMSSFLLKGEELALEKKNSEMRLLTIRPVLEKILGISESNSFIQNYLSLMTNSSSTMFFNKFIVKGINK
jgi:ubiquinone/menaquinone biosynthesis C-methylase UbiE